jgi:hypothetical protein
MHCATSRDDSQMLPGMFRLQQPNEVCHLRATPPHPISLCELHAGTFQRLAYRLMIEPHQPTLARFKGGYGALTHSRLTGEFVPRDSEEGAGGTTLCGRWDHGVSLHAQMVRRNPPQLIPHVCCYLALLMRPCMPTVL